MNKPDYIPDADLEQEFYALSQDVKTDKSTIASNVALGVGQSRLENSRLAIDNPGNWTTVLGDNRTLAPGQNILDAKQQNIKYIDDAFRTYRAQLAENGDAEGFQKLNVAQKFYVDQMQKEEDLQKILLTTDVSNAAQKRNNAMSYTNPLPEIAPYPDLVKAYEDIRQARIAKIQNKFGNPK